MIWIYAMAMGHATPCEGFVGPIAPDRWRTSQLTDGSTAVELQASTDQQLVLRYQADAGDGVGGVLYQEAFFSTVLPENTALSFDYTYEYDHGLYDVEARLAFLGAVEIELVDEGSNGVVIRQGSVPNGTSTPSGRIAFVIGGSNTDFDAHLLGKLTIENLRFDHPSCDCAKELEGKALLDACGECDADPLNDCVVDCLGDAGGLAYIDDCGECVGGNSGSGPCVPEWTGDTADDVPSAGVASEGCRCNQRSQPWPMVFEAFRRRRGN